MKGSPFAVRVLQALSLPKCGNVNFGHLSASSGYWHHKDAQSGKQESKSSIQASCVIYLYISHFTKIILLKLKGALNCELYAVS